LQSFSISSRETERAAGRVTRIRSAVKFEFGTDSSRPPTFVGSGRVGGAEITVADVLNI
jgi:hypothetical protein